MATNVRLALKEGDVAPAFTALTQDGKALSLADFKGKSVILYFYPRDNTPGCTKEACGFRNDWETIQRKGAVVLGVSNDSVKSHQKFASSFKLPFPLLADEDKRIVTAYGAYGEKSFLGRNYMGIHRITFLIDPKGLIQKIWTRVKVTTHSAEVLAALG